MIRRRRPSPSRPAPGPGARATHLLPRLRAAGWVLPAGLTSDVAPTVTRLGVVDGPTTATVDHRGLVTSSPAWSLDWWVGADDRWHVPAREARVDQIRVDDAPIVTTTLRVPGGEVVHRAYGVRSAAFPGGDEWLVVEVENATAVPVALAWAVRPLTASRIGRIEAVRVVPVDPAVPGGAHRVEIDGQVALVLPRRPSRWAVGTGGVDPVAVVLAGDASTDDLAGAVAHDPEDGLATLALLVPLPHTATARILIPRGAWPAPDGALGLGPVEPPPAEVVARGWTALAERGPRVELPDPILTDAVAAARRSLLLAHRVRREAAATDREQPPVVHTVTAGDGWAPADPVADRMEILSALATWGDADTVDRALVDWPADQQRGGGFGSSAATAAALRALAAHAVAADDFGPAQAWLPEVGGAVEALGRATRRAATDEDRRAGADGLDAAAVLLAGLDQPEAAARVAAHAVEAAGRLDGAADGAPVPSVAPDAPSVTPRQLAEAAVVATRAGAPAPVLWALLRRTSATWTWSDPERWAGDDGLVPARLLTAVAQLLVADGPGGLALVPWMPPSWWGLGWEVHRLPTRWGHLSYAVRWHSGRPAVLWEVGDPVDGVVGPVVLTAPGLDPTWRATERVGEVLLGPVARPPEAVPGSDGPAGTGAVAIAAPPRSVWRPQDAGPDAPPSADPSPAGDPVVEEPRAAEPPAPDGGSFS